MGYARRMGQQLSQNLESLANIPTAVDAIGAPNAPDAPGVSHVIELVGDVGAGKTTFARGLAEGLGATEPVTSPSFTISKRYAIKNGTLAHYDFYRLPEPGLMSEDLAESIADPHTVTVVEWANTVDDILPPEHLVFTITVEEDGSRTVEVHS